MEYYLLIRMNCVVLSLGSNVGDREQFLSHAILRLGEFINDLKVSSIYRTDAVGMEKGHDFEFMNMVCYGFTTHSAEQVLQLIIQIEKSLGRERGSSENYLSRTIDIDILFYNDTIINEKDLTIPHPRLMERWFVLEPLNEILPNLIIPGSNITVEKAFLIL